MLYIERAISKDIINTHTHTHTYTHTHLRHFGLLPAAKQVDENVLGVPLVQDLRRQEHKSAVG